MSSAEIFTNACRALWGAAWQTAAAEALGISLSSVVRYAAGGRVVPLPVLRKLSGLIDRRRGQLAGLQSVVDRVRS